MRPQRYMVSYDTLSLMLPIASLYTIKHFPVPEISNFGQTWATLNYISESESLWVLDSKTLITFT